MTLNVTPGKCLGFQPRSERSSASLANPFSGAFT